VKAWEFKVGLGVQREWMVGCLGVRRSYADDLSKNNQCHAMLSKPPLQPSSTHPTGSHSPTELSSPPSPSSSAASYYSHNRPPHFRPPRPNHCRTSPAYTSYPVNVPTSLTYYGLWKVRFRYVRILRRRRRAPIACAQTLLSFLPPRSRSRTRGN